MTDQIVLNGNDFSLEDLVRIAREAVRVQLSEASLDRIIKSRQLIDKWVEKEERIYGVTTGFGALSTVPISRDDTRKLQKNILDSMVVL